MPNKTIYIRDEDLPIFEQAERLGGDSLSAVIAEALKRFVAVKQAEAQGMRGFTLEAGTIRPAGQGDDDLRKVRFVGRLLVEGKTLHGQTSSSDDRGTDYRIYLTQAGKILVWWEDWSCWQGESNTLDYVVLDALPGYDAELYGKVARGQGYDTPPVLLPGSLLQEAAEALGQELVEFVE